MVQLIHIYIAGLLNGAADSLTGMRQQGLDQNT